MEWKKKRKENRDQGPNSKRFKLDAERKSERNRKNITYTEWMSSSSSEEEMSSASEEEDDDDDSQDEFNQQGKFFYFPAIFVENL
jgi:hypothetical protein